MAIKQKIMFYKLFSTKAGISFFFLRVALGTVMLGHGVQKAFGWFGGFGWTNTVNYFTDTVGVPAVLGALVIIIETLGALLLIIGLAGRINAALMAIVITGAFFQDHLANGFFMNWFGNQKGEGFEFDILFFAIATVLTINGSGSFSIDKLITGKAKRVMPEKINVAFS
jgi:putative oxidoreductase